MKNRVLLVDCAPGADASLRSLLIESKEEWDTRSVGSGRAALDHLEENDCDIVIAGVDIDDMNGTDLLRRIQEKFPETVRMLLAHKADWDEPLRSPGAYHQVVPDRCDRGEFRRATQRAVRMRDLVLNERLRRVVEQVETLPSLPGLYMQIVEEMNSADPSIARVGEIVSRDMAMSSKMLQLVNSPAFGTRNRITDPAQATVFLGLDTIKGLVLTVKLFDRIRENTLPSFPFVQLWEHSFRVGTFARIIGRQVGLQRHELDVCFTAGLLHDIGQLVLATSLAGQYINLRELAELNGISLYQLEEETFGATHAEIGAYLIGLWGLDEDVFEAVLLHHRPGDRQADALGPVDAVYLANIIDHGPRDDNHDAAEFSPAIDHLARIGLEERFGDLRAACLAADE